MAVLAAVITADIVNSTKLPPGKETQLIREIKSLCAPHKIELFRGDSFQVYLPDAKEALNKTLLCRTAAIAISEPEVPCDIRSSIGIGNVVTPVKALATAKGEAFLLSGRNFDALPKNIRLKIAVENLLAQTALDILSNYIDAIFANMSSKQAEVILELLKGNTQQQTAERLKKSKSTINQHVSAGRWEEIENLLEKYQLLINQLQ